MSPTKDCYTFSPLKVWNINTTDMLFFFFPVKHRFYWWYWDALGILPWGRGQAEPEDKIYWSLVVEFWLSWMKESEDQAGDCQAQLSWLHLHWELGWSQESRFGRQSMGIHRTKGRWVRKASLLLTVFLWTATVAVKITMGSDCSHDIKRCLLLWRKAMTNLDNVWKSRDISLLRKVNRVSSVVSKSLWPMDCRTAGFPVHHKLSEHAQTHVHRVSDAIQPTYLLQPFLLLPSILSSIRVFSSELALGIRWPKYWSFSFSISPSNEYSGLISFRIDWFDLLAVQGTLKSLLQHYSSKASIVCTQPSLWSKSHIHTWLLEKP